MCAHEWVLNIIFIKNVFLYKIMIYLCIAFGKSIQKYFKIEVFFLH